MILGFQKQFAHKILEGSKKFTIRTERKITPKVGETIHMYSGLRTKHTEFISKEHKYTSCQKVKIEIELLGAGSFRLDLAVSDNGITSFRRLSDAERSRFVKHDGFISQRAFIDYWRDEFSKPTIHMIAIRTIYHWTDLRY